MSVLVPGSAHLAVGRRGIGRAAMGAWILGVLALLAAGVAVLADRDATLGFLAQPWVLYTAAAVAFVGAVLWALLVLHALRLANLSRQGRGAHVVLVGLALLCAVALVVAGTGVGRGLHSTARLSDDVFGGGGRTETIEGRWNILLLGGDDGAGRDGTRFDSINVVSVDAAIGKAVLIGIPRNLEGVPFPESSPMHDLYPDGYWCPTHECLINAINYDVEANHTDLYKGVKRPGIQATQEAVEGLTGLTINYWVTVDLAGFQQLIDSVGGIRIALDKAVPIWWDATETRVTYAIGPGDDIHLDGEKALWFVRARSDSDDYVRMSRQRCVMNAMLHQLDPPTVLSRFNEIAAAGGGVVSTNVPATEAGTLAKVALKVRDTPYATLPLVPPLINPGDPDFELIQRLVAAAVREVSATPTPSPTVSSTPTRGGTPTTGASPTTGGSSWSPTIAPTSTTAPASTWGPTSASPTPDPTPEQQEVEAAENCRPAA